MRYPDFIIIGGIKCGTTALWFNLDKHPDISMAMPENKEGIEMNFWRKARFRRGINWYKSRFDPNAKLVGEKSAGYSVSGKSMLAIKNHIPNVKLLYCIRNPIDRTYSNYRMNLKKGIAIRPLELNLKRYHQASKYIICLNRYILKHFSRHQLHICIMERMKNNAQEEMRKVFEFLGVEDLKYRVRDVGVFEKTIDHIRKSRDQKFYRKWSLQKGLKDRKRRKILYDFYKESNEQLFDFLGYRIPEWEEF